MSANLHEIHETFAALGEKLDAALAAVSARIGMLEAALAGLVPSSPPTIATEVIAEADVTHLTEEKIGTSNSSEVWFHGNMSASPSASFYVYPLNNILPNVWDTHLTPSEFCCNHKKGGAANGPKGQVHYVCLGHNSLAEFEEAEKEWKRESYSCASLGPLRHGAPRTGPWTNIQLGAWKQRVKQSKAE